MPRKAVYFTYTSRAFFPDEKKAVFGYEIGFEEGEPLVCSETIVLSEIPMVGDLPQDVIETILDDLHIMLGISYYKLYCPPEIRISRKLSAPQARFWETVYRKGLGEFAFRNDLDVRGITFPITVNTTSPAYSLVRKERALVGIGGGKDSVAALELLKERGYARDGFIVETHVPQDIAANVAREAGVDTTVFRRILDSVLFDTSPGAYSGHIPVSAIYAFLGLFAAVLYDYKYVIVGNEHSSNFGNIEYLGEIVNHQWSKSAEFEKLFQDYVREYITDSVTYFSLLRPFHEIRIAEIFAKYPRYFPVISSCNRRFRIDSAERPKGNWCGECAKCAFVFLMLAPFIEKTELITMFGKDLLDDEKLVPMYRDLLGFGALKPFDCVGTLEEAHVALFLVREKWADAHIVKEFIGRITPSEKEVQNVFSVAQALTVPTFFRFCGMKNALILGYGREGKASEVWLKAMLPNLMIDTADAASDAQYLDKQDEYDIVIKTPGIPKEKVRAQYVTATNLFFANFKGATIGITGSKGKSTTTSLVHAILSEAGKPARLAGNIGVPMLELASAPPETIAVLELSSYQLDDIEFSPHIAVITNLFPDHMNYHGDEEKYYDAKRNILRFQQTGDIFIFNPAVPQLQEWAKGSRAEAVSFLEKLPFTADAVPLLGEHNLANVRAATTVARRLGVSDAAIESAVRKFEGLPHRLEFVGEYRGITFFDDAISTTPESTIAALRAVPNVKTIFLGGQDRGYDFSALELEIRKLGIKNIVLFPDSGPKMFLNREGLNILETRDMQEAVAFAYANTPKGSACLLSTASPSYSVWKNFEEKGDIFQNAVRTP